MNFSSKLLIAGLFTKICFSLSFAQTLDDSHWEPRYGPAGVNGPIYAAVTYGQFTYVGGEFTIAGGIPARNIAVFDGRRWYGLGNGIDGPVRALSVDWDGTLYCGGNFAQAGNIPAQNVAKWDGTNWSALGGGTDGPVEAVAAYGQTVFVGGQFESAGGVEANNIARWDATGWQALGAPGTIGTDGAVSTIAMDNADHIYIGGRFSRAGAATTFTVAEWKDGQWSPMGELGNLVQNGAEPPVVTQGIVNVLHRAGDGSMLIAGGQFNFIGGEKTDFSEKNLASWDGTKWVLIGGGVTGGPVNSLFLGGTGLYVGGSFTKAGPLEVPGVAIWNVDQNQWSVMSQDKDGPGDVRAVGNTPGGGLLVAGLFTRAAGTEVNNIAFWEGNSFRSLGEGVHGEVYGLEALSNNLLFAGAFDRVAGVLMNNTALAGATYPNWYPFPGGPNGLVRTFVATDYGWVAGGDFIQAGGSPALHLARHNGVWMQDLGGVTGENATVFSIASSQDGNTIFVGGRFANAGETPARNIAAWDGTWTALGEGLNGEVHSLLVEGDQIIVGGSFTQAGGSQANGIALWNITEKTWAPLGDGIGDLTSGADTPVVNAIVLLGGQIYVGGRFTKAGTIAANSIARWDGSQWNSLGTGEANGVNGVIYTLGALGPQLYVGGLFDRAGGVSANNIARWAGETWQALGTGTDGAVRCMSFNFNSLFLGGSFQKAGGHPSLGLALWNVAERPVVKVAAPLEGADFANGQPIELKAELSGFIEPPASIQYYIPSQPIIVRELPPYSAMLPAPPEGQYIVGVYAYDSKGNYFGSTEVSFSVLPPAENIPPIVVLTSPVDGDKFAALEPITLTADASDPDGTIDRVEFYFGTSLNILLGTATTAPYSVNITLSETGPVPVEIAARAIDNKGGATFSKNRVAISVLRTNFPPEVFFDEPFDNALLSSQRPLLISATATDRGRRVPRLDLFANDFPLASLQGVKPDGDENTYFSFQWENPPPGNYILTAKATDDDGAATSKSLRVSVVPAAQPAGSLIWPATSPRLSFAAPDGPINAMVELNGIIYLGGSFSRIGETPRRGLAAINAVDGSLTAWNPDNDGKVNALLVSGQTIIAAGAFGNVGGAPRSNLAAIDLAGISTAWAPQVGGEITAVVSSGNALYAAGNFSTAGGQPRAFLAAFDLATGALLPWDPQPDAKVHALSSAGDKIYLGGEFTTLHNLPRARLASVDPALGLAGNWEADVDGAVYALAMQGRILFAGGTFQNVGGKSRKFLTAIDAETARPTAWTADADAAVRRLAFGEGVLYATGDFNNISGVPSRHAAGLDIRLQTPNATSWNPIPLLEANLATIQSILFTKPAVYLGGTLALGNVGVSYFLRGFDLPIRFEAAAKSTGQIKWMIQGPLGQEITVESSTDFLDWNPVTTKLPPFELEAATTPTPTYYRALSP